MSIAETAEAAQRTASAVMYGGALTSTGSGASVGAALYFGLPMEAWQVAGIVGGLVIGALGLVANMTITVYFKRQHLLLARAKAQAEQDEE